MSKVKEPKEKKHYFVETHVGTHDTWATSEAKAISQNSRCHSRI